MCGVELGDILVQFGPYVLLNSSRRKTRACAADLRRKSYYFFSLTYLLKTYVHTYLFRLTCLFLHHEFKIYLTQCFLHTYILIYLLIFYSGMSHFVTPNLHHKFEFHSEKVHEKEYLLTYLEHIYLLIFSYLFTM